MGFVSSAMAISGRFLVRQGFYSLVKRSISVGTLSIMLSDTYLGLSVTTTALDGAQMPRVVTSKPVLQLPAAAVLCSILD